MSSMNILNLTGANMDPWGTPLLTASIRLWTTDHNPMNVTAQPLSYPSNSSLIKSICHKFREKDIVEDHVKGSFL